MSCLALNIDFRLLAIEMWIGWWSDATGRDSSRIDSLQVSIVGVLEGVGRPHLAADPREAPKERERGGKKE